MKLIIDIPEDIYTRLFDCGIQDNEIAVDDVCEMARALRMGTPLNDDLANLAKCIKERIENGESVILYDGRRYRKTLLADYLNAKEIKEDRKND